jgi:tRNA (guanine-N7-)-methyltransferase
MEAAMAPITSPLTLRFSIEPKDLEGPVTSQSLFGNRNPLELEIGAGKGTFLVKESTLRPEVNFLGIEYAWRYWIYAADRLRRAARDNARVVLTEAFEFIGAHLADDDLSGVHIYFPDPWPKTRHRTRRLLQQDFVALLTDKMNVGARVQIATDHEDYFAHIERVIKRSTLVQAPFEIRAAADGDELVGSNFERKYRSSGQRIYSIAAVKV